jgi:hypothetical protein
VAEWAWKRQSVWSQTANRLKRSLDRARGTALSLTIAGAVLATLATQVAALSSVAGRALALGAAIAVGLVPLVRRRVGRTAVQDWTRARSVSEALKSDVFTFLAGAAPYRKGDREHELQGRTDALLRDAGDLLHHTTGIEPVQRELPPVHDVHSYSTERLTQQIDRFYRPKAEQLGRRLSLVRRAEFALGALAVVLAAVAATLQQSSAAAWIAVVTTVTAALTAHAAAGRYEYQMIEYLRTAAELERLRALRARFVERGIEGEDDFVRQSEHVISIQNEAWMAKWASETSQRTAAPSPAPPRPPADPAPPALHA